tara:strand:- start:379 stop:654 length:276 start_codon:yes stop_codon:yes gene_type:complete
MDLVFAMLDIMEQTVQKHVQAVQQLHEILAMGMEHVVMVQMEMDLVLAMLDIIKKTVQEYVQAVQVKVLAMGREHVVMVQVGMEHVIVMEL